MKKSTIFFGLFILLLAGFLRFYKITTVPPGLYIDEASIGYNAYSVLTTGKDEHGVAHPLWFQAFGEYKMPVYIYMTEGAIAAFGKNEFAVRFPSAFFGTLTVLLVYLLLLEITQDWPHIGIKKIKIGIAELAAFLLAISPWHLQFSRAGFEATVGLFFFVAAIFVIQFYSKKQQFLLLLSSFLLFVVTIYTYDVYRILTPLTLFLIFLYFFFKKPRIRLHLFISAFICLLLCLPILQFTLTSQGLARFSQTSAFSGYKTTSFIQEMILYPMIFLKNYISYFSFLFLFISGDGIGSHQIPGFGVLSLWQFPFLVIGLISLIAGKLKIKYIVLIFLFIIPLGASIAVPSPHSLRSLPLVIPLIIIISFGILSFLNYFKDYKKLLFGFVIIVVCLYEFSFYLQTYYVSYPRTNSLDWGAEYKAVVIKATDYSKKYPIIVVDNSLGLSYIYFLFYNNKLHVFYVPTKWVKPKKWENKKVLYIRNGWISSAGKLLYTINLQNLNKDPFAKFWQL